MSDTLPKGWSNTSYSEVLSRRKETHTNDGVHPLYSLTIEKGVTPKSDRYEREFLVKDKGTKKYAVIYPNDLVFNPSNLRWGAIARSKVPFKVLASPIYEVCEPNTQKINAEYLGYLATSDLMMQRYLQFVQGTLVERTGLHIDDFLPIPISIPPLTEQRKIAEILTSVDEVIENTQSQINKLEDLKKATMNELLTKGIGHTKFKDTEIGRVPKEWNVKTLGSITEKISDRDHTTPIYVDADCGVPIISPKDITDNMEFDLSHIKYITKDAHLKNRKKTDLRPRDIIFSRIGAGLGKSVLLTKDFFDFSILHSLCLIRPNENLVNSEYLLWQLRDSGFQRRLTLGIQSIGVPDLGLKEIGHLKVALPTDKLEQSEISQILNGIVQQRYCLKCKNDKFVKLKQSLMQDLLTGKVRVTVN